MPHRITMTHVVISLVAITALIFGINYVVAPERSVKSYCQTWQNEGQKLRNKWAKQQQQAKEKDDILLSISMIMGTPRDMADFFGKLDEVAPSDIEPDIKRYREAWQETADNLGENATNPLGFLLAQLMVSAQTADTERRITAWTKSNCTATGGQS